jgi:hypothetical protein
MRPQQRDRERLRQRIPGVFWMGEKTPCGRPSFNEGRLQEGTCLNEGHLQEHQNAGRPLFTRRPLSSEHHLVLYYTIAHSYMESMGMARRDGWGGRHLRHIFGPSWAMTGTIICPTIPLGISSVRVGQGRAPSHMPNHPLGIFLCRVGQGRAPSYAQPSLWAYFWAGLGKDGSHHMPNHPFGHIFVPGWARTGPIICPTIPLGIFLGRVGQSRAQPHMPNGLGI